MTRQVYVIRDHKLVPKDEAAPLAGSFHYWRDLPAYKSPLGDGLVIEGRAARREHLKRNGCRECDPSEFKVEYQNERFARKHGLPWVGDER